MNISFEGKVALVTGAASGLGLATAKAFAESGASVALADWNESAVRAAADELTAQGYKAIAIRCDVADDAQVEAMVARTVEALESVRRLQVGLHSFLSMRRIEARRKNASAFRLRFSQSLASLRQRLSQAMVRSTIQRFGKTANPLT